VVIDHAAFVPAVHLDIGGVEIDRRRCGQPGAARHRQMVQHPLVNPSHPGLHFCPLWTSKLARQAAAVVEHQQAQPAHVAEANVADLAGGDQVVERSQGLLDRGVAVQSCSQYRST
jgi:hypothetical protein